MAKGSQCRRSCCFTGHRPEKLTDEEQSIRCKLNEAIQRAIMEGYRTFITGMCRGIDLWAAQIVLRFREADPDIRLICALPHPHFSLRWSPEWKAQYSDILNHADMVEIISEAPSMHCYQKRNEWMVDHSSLVIAVYNATKGGTRNTVEYAKKQGVSVTEIIG